MINEPAYRVGMLNYNNVSAPVSLKRLDVSQQAPSQLSENASRKDSAHAGTVNLYRLLETETKFSIRSRRNPSRSLNTSEHPKS